MSAWTDFVKKVYNEGNAKDSNYHYKQAMKDASARKSEMGSSMGNTNSKTKKQRKSRKSKKSKKSRKHRK